MSNFTGGSIPGTKKYKRERDKLKAKNVDFKKMKRKEMSKDEFIKKYPKSITAQKHHGLRK